jgi:hypothetical protein
MRILLSFLLILLAGRIAVGQNYSGDTWANVKANKAGTIS